MIDAIFGENTAAQILRIQKEAQHTNTKRVSHHCVT